MWSDAFNSSARRVLQGTILKLSGFAALNKLWGGKAETESAFVVGCGHSGTSILMRMLAEHSAIYAVPGETGLFISGKSKSELRESIACYNEEAARAGKRLWVEKTPKHVAAIDAILTHLPNAKIVGMARDPRDAACSLKARGFSFEKGLDRWLEDNMHLYHRRAARNLHLIKLEELIRSPNQEIERVLGFLGLPNQNLLDYHEKPKSWYAGDVVIQKPENGLGPNHDRLRNWQINRPLFKSTDRHSTEMTEADHAVFQARLTAIAPIARFLGYEVGDIPLRIRAAVSEPPVI